MSPDQRSSEDRLQKLRLILRTMEAAVDDAKSRRTSEDEPPSRQTSPESMTGPTASDAASPATGSIDGGRHGVGRDIPGPESLPRAKAKPKGFAEFSTGRPPLGRTG